MCPSAKLNALNRERYLDLTVQGRKTGKPHTVRIWFIVKEGKIYVSSGRGSDSQWIKNLRQTPKAVCRIGSSSIEGTAKWISGRSVAEEVFSLFFRKYFMARIFQWFGWYAEDFAFEFVPDYPSS